MLFISAMEFSEIHHALIHISYPSIGCSYHSHALNQVHRHLPFIRTEVTIPPSHDCYEIWSTRISADDGIRKGLRRQGRRREAIRVKRRGS
ncbi:unnamed protein product [Microthlaspi erraticum]|uniref:Uncharacterized protein n=1 Tax=Microthlaspi erraticum TaxID=1685480 RepID=A0A6D2KB70_9BRAS|nr:unnamed protein product [Microthlaspi erraticum]